jgi:hypothetical protein
MQKSTFESCKNQLSSIKCKAFFKHIGDMDSDSKLILQLEGLNNFKDTTKYVNTTLSQKRQKAQCFT